MGGDYLIWSCDIITIYDRYYSTTSSSSRCLMTIVDIRGKFNEDTKLYTHQISSVIHPCESYRIPMWYTHFRPHLWSWKLLFIDPTLNELTIAVDITPYCHYFSFLYIGNLSELSKLSPIFFYSPLFFYSFFFFFLLF